jgi:two-component system response regulator NreC
MTKVLIVDDHAIVRTGLRALLHSEQTLHLVGEATGGYEAIALVTASQPDIVVLDLSMPDLDGIAVTRHLKALYPDLRILILTLHEDEALLREAIRSGANGYILKQAAEAELLSAIKIVMRGDMYVDPSVLRGILEEEPRLASSTQGSTASLTPREIDVLKLIAQGYTNRQIGEELNISVRTVEGHRANLTGKVGLRRRVDLVRYAREHGFLD